MTVYNPDVWVILKITSTEGTHYRVLAGWYGGYLGGDSWQMNSGITKVVKKGNILTFHGTSGSKYKCRVGNEKLSGMTSSIYSSLKKNESEGVSIEIVKFSEVEWNKI